MTRMTRMTWLQGSYPVLIKKKFKDFLRTIQGQISHSSRTPIIALSIQLFRERLSGKVHATILKGIVDGFEFSFFPRNLKELARKAMEMCLRVLKESNKSRFDSYSRQEQCIDHIPYYLSGLLRAHVFRQTFSK